MSTEIIQPGQPIAPGAPIEFFAPPTGSGSGPLTEIPEIAVWPVRPQIPMAMSKAFDNLIADFGDGFEMRANKNQAYLHADGQGGVTSNKGRWEFKVQLNGVEHEVDTIWDFITARCGPRGSFYFYNPIEAEIDLTGTETIGRYLVRLKDPIVTLEAFMIAIHRGSLSFIEVRS